MAGAPGIGAGRQRRPRAAAPLPGTYATRRRRAPAAADAPAGTRCGRERAAERQAADRERLQQYNRAKADYANRDNACATCQACQEDVPCVTCGDDSHHVPLGAARDRLKKTIRRYEADHPLAPAAHLLINGWNYKVTFKGK